jgi:hypothetical protein
MKVSTLILAVAGVCFAAQSEPAPATPAPSRPTDRIDALTEVAKLRLEDKYSLNLEPGVYARREGGALQIASYSGRKIQIRAGNERISLDSPATLKLTPEGWTLGDGRVLPAASLQVAQQDQDDTDKNLKSMQDAAKKLRSKTEPANNPQTPKPNLHVRWLYSDNPMPTAEMFNTPAIQQLVHISAIGF